MKTQRFHVEVTLDDETRELLLAEELRRDLEFYLRSFFRTWTTGPVPDVRISMACLHSYHAAELVEELRKRGFVIYNPE